MDKPQPSRLRRFFSQLGPGLVTGAADDDPSGIGTHSQVLLNVPVTVLDDSDGDLDPESAAGQSPAHEATEDSWADQEEGQEEDISAETTSST